MLDKLLINFDAWVVMGLLAQVAFTGRFVVQWLASERCGKSVVPISFWYLSLLGSSGLLLYAFVRADPVFILGQSLGLFIYSRNLALIYREKRHLGMSAPSAGS